MIKEKKAKVVEMIAGELARSNFIVAMDYRGLSVAELTRLRRQLREAGTRCMVVKNTLAKLAAKKVNKEGLVALLEGPTSLALGQGEPLEAARALTAYLRAAKGPLTIKGGLLNQRVVNTTDIQALSTMPPREVLLSQVAGAIQAPLSSLLGVLTANIAALAWVLQSRVKQLEAK